MKKSKRINDASASFVLFPFTHIDGIEQLIDRLATLTHTGGHKYPISNTDPHRTGLYTRRKKPLYTGQEVYWRHPHTGQVRQLNPKVQYGYVRQPFGYRYADRCLNFH